MPQSLESQLKTWGERAQERAEAVIKQAIQDVVEDAEVPRAVGGRMRVDTGFLRNSIVAAIGKLPVGPSEGPRKTAAGVEWRDPIGEGSSSVMSVLAQWRFDQPLYVGWSANYAEYREQYDGFMQGAVQRWPEFINSAIRRMNQ